jgi:ribosomal protein S18 acetylase RimI-like enzyme
MIASARRIFAEDGEFLLGAAGDGPPEAVCQLRYRWSVWTTSEDCWLEDLFVRAGARGSGLGRALVDAAVERARARGCGRIELDVDDSNDVAIALYESSEFSLDSKGAPGRNLLAGRRLRDGAG